MTEIRVRDLGQECAVCLEPMDNPKDVNYVNCGHIFHRACIEAWNQREGSCPIDRARITKMGALQTEEAPAPASAPVQAEPVQAPEARTQAPNNAPKRKKITAKDFFKPNSFEKLIQQQMRRSGTKPKQRCGGGQETMAQHINKRRNHCHAGSRC